MGRGTVKHLARMWREALPEDRWCLALGGLYAVLVTLAAMLAAGAFG